MIRAIMYLFASAVIWFGEGYVFSHFLNFSALQTGLLVAVYSLLFTFAVVLLIRFARTYHVPQDGIAVWRLLSLAPMLVLVLGSFISLPLVMAIAAAS